MLQKQSKHIMMPYFPPQIILNRLRRSSSFVEVTLSSEHPIPGAGHILLFASQADCAKVEIQLCNVYLIESCEINHLDVFFIFFSWSSRYVCICIINAA